VEPGRIVAIVGPNGAGKTTLLEILVGLRQPQNGRVLLGGRDIRQFDPGDYRAWVGYVPQLIRGLPMTISEAFRLRCPTATDEEIKSALERVAGERWWSMIGANSPDVALQHHAIFTGLENREAVRGRFIDRLAAATLNNPPLVLLDDPLGDRDPALDGHLIELIKSLRGHSTVLIATHRPDLIQLADDIVVLNDGQLVHFGPVSPTPTGSQP
jgi:ABC-type multidrug transport system fused ATPase/permease subunit